MAKAGRRRILGWLAAAALAAAGALHAAPSAAAEVFDGNWNIHIYGSEGACAFGYTLPISIKARTVLYKGRSVSRAVVGITSAGTVAIYYNDGGRMVVTGSGALRGRSGSGKWKTSMNNCTGIWRAVKR